MAYERNRRIKGKRPDNHRPLWWVLVAKYGVLGACRVLWTDVIYDFIHRVDTARPAGLGGLDKVLRGADYNRYVPSTFSAVSASLRHLRLLDADVNLSQCGFVDIGAGKGKALIAAAREPFAYLIGIEIDKGLQSKAVANLRRLNLQQRVTVHLADASDYRPQVDDRIFYFFNPFTGDTLEKCLSGIACSSVGTKRFVIYLNPTEDESFCRYFDKLDEVTFSPGSVEVNFYATR